MYISMTAVILSIILALLVLWQRAFNEDTGDQKHAALRQALESHQANFEHRNRSKSQHLRSILATFGLDEDDLYRNVSDPVQR